MPTRAVWGLSVAASICVLALTVTVNQAHLKLYRRVLYPPLTASLFFQVIKVPVRARLACGGVFEDCHGTPRGPPRPRGVGLHGGPLSAVSAPVPDTDITAVSRAVLAGLGMPNVHADGVDRKSVSVRRKRGNWPFLVGRLAHFPLLTL